MDVHAATYVSDGIALSWTNEAPVLVTEQALGLESSWAAVTNAPALTASNTWSLELPSEHRNRPFQLQNP
jgi:hypothetical protein